MYIIWRIIFNPVIWQEYIHHLTFFSNPLWYWWASNPTPQNGVKINSMYVSVHRVFVRLLSYFSSGIRKLCETNVCCRKFFTYVVYSIPSMKFLVNYKCYTNKYLSRLGKEKCPLRNRRWVFCLHISYISHSALVKRDY